ncbi:c-type cytochrome [Rhodopseudomonas palustris]|uniref:c-type cytochrome n=1 Tax=Rhodopseudomonas palustris TaxID=1076 RepID=UPI00131EC0F5|nr:cytochrome c family protein [Rhodopseudomonas palustris]
MSLINTARGEDGQIMRCLMMIMAVTLSLTDAGWSDTPTPEQRAFQQCQGCHQIGPNAKNGMGPVLTGIIGRESASISDYTYSPAMKQSRLVWTEDNIRAFLHKPRKFVPFTKMTFSGLDDDEVISLILGYLKQFPASNPR